MPVAVHTVEIFVTQRPWSPFEVIFLLFLFLRFHYESHLNKTQEAKSDRSIARSPAIKENPMVQPHYVIAVLQSNCTIAHNPAN